MDWNSAEFLKSAMDITALPHDRKPQIALFGRSNVGKSSLINSLTKQKGLARSSNTPGRTQAMNVFLVDDRFYLIDLPGYGFTKASAATSEKFQRLIIEYLDSNAAIALALLIVDARHEPTKQDLAMAESLADRDVPFVVIANKIDKLGNKEKKERLDALKTQFVGSTILAHSSETAVGRGEIVDLITRAIK